MLRAISRAVSRQNSFVKNFHASAISRVRLLTVEKPNDNTTVIDCKYINSPRQPYLLKTEDKDDKCSLCKLKLDLKHTDVLILSQFIDPKGNLFKFKETKLCYTQYKLVKELIFMAQYAGLLPEPPRKEPKKPYHLLNTYYDEATINLRKGFLKRNMRLYYLEKKLAPIEKLRINTKAGLYYGRKIY